MNNDSDFRLALNGRQLDQYGSFNGLNEKVPRACAIQRGRRDDREDAVRFF